jgi:hypothetical protein
MHRNFGLVGPGVRIWLQSCWWPVAAHLLPPASPPALVRGSVATDRPHYTPPPPPPPASCTAAADQKLGINSLFDREWGRGKPPDIHSDRSA